MPQKVVKGQALANFLDDHPNNLEPQEQCEIWCITRSPWKLWFDSTKIEVAAVIGFVI